MTSQYKHVIYWRDTEPVVPGPPLAGRVTADVCIIGGGYTGLWAAHFLLKAEPALTIHILEADYAGAGASGHNDGFATPTVGKDLSNLVNRFGPEQAALATNAVGRSILELGRFCRQNEVDAEYEVSGYLMVAVSDRQRGRLERDRDLALKLGGNTSVTIMDRAEAQEHVGSPAIQAAMRVGGALVNPHKLARGLARVVTAQGATIHEGTRALRIEPGRAGHVVTTPGGEVVAEKVIVATDAYQHTFPRFRRKVIPVWSYAMVTDPLTPEQLERINWPGREGLVEARTFLNAGRFTADNRIFWAGGRAHYFYDRNMDERHMLNAAPYRELRQSFERYFPMWTDVPFRYAYGGALGITRDFVPHFGSDGQGVFYGYGYCGNGISASHTGGKILRDLVLGKDSAYSQLPFVDRKEQSCPPEPIMYVGARAKTWLLDLQER